LRPLVQTALIHYRDAGHTGAFPVALLDAFRDYARRELKRTPVMASAES
jgi:hypothetical protein